MSPAPPEDLAIVAKLRAGDDGAFADLVERYHSRLVRLALGFVADSATAEEVVQDTWIAVLAGLAGFEGRSTLKTWIFRILVNRAKTRGVREARSVPFSSLGDDPGAHEPAVEPSRFRANGGWAEPPPRDTPEDLLLRAEAMSLLQAELVQLPAQQRAVVTLRDVEGLSAEEACNILAISDTNQRVLLHRARSRLHRALERYVASK